MLNLKPIFDDAVIALEQYIEYLAVPPLPAAVFMMQRDVINHYRHALSHYFDLTLDESFLQNSSLGSPYVKWAKFTNDDFELLSFAIHNLLRYTSRLVHETEYRGLKAARQFSEMKSRSNSYTNPICDIKYQSRNIGLCVTPDAEIVRTPFAFGPKIEGVLSMSAQVGGETIWEHTTTDASGATKTVRLSKAEYQELDQTLREYRHDIRDRAVIASLKAEGLREIEVLDERNAIFGGLCNRYYQRQRPAAAFDAMNQSWWV